MRRRTFFAAFFLLATLPLTADVSLTDKGAAFRAELRAANQAKHAAKLTKHATSATHSKSKGTSPSTPVAGFATGSISLIDAGGLKYFINSNITFSTSSSASAAMSEASYTHAVAASTLNGGSVASTLNDMFDGYNTLCVSLTNTTGTCETGNSNFNIYQKLGPATVDTSVPAIATCTGRQYVFPVQTVGGLHVQRKVFVPTNDKFARWMNYFTNTTGSPITFSISIANNLGSDSNTVITGSSSGDLAAQTNDTWVATFQNYSGTTSSDPRIGHILQGANAPTPVSAINFANGDDNPWWSYSITLAPGQTKAIANFVTGAPSKALAASQAAAIAAFGANEQQCLSGTELAEIANFSTADLAILITPSTTHPIGGIPMHYTINVTNNGPVAANGVSVSFPIPAGMTYGGATGTGWTCGFASNTVTCTLPTLAIGAANPITVTATPPAAGGTITGTTTVGGSGGDPNPGNNTSSTPALPVSASTAIPALGLGALALLGVALAIAAAVILKR